MKNLFFLFFIFVFTCTSFAQKEIDSFKQLLNDSSISKEQKASIYNKISDTYCVQGKPEYGLIYAQKAYDIAESINNKEELNEALSNLYRNYITKNRYDSAFSIAKRLLKIYLSDDNKYQMAIQYSRLGTVYSNLGLIEKAMDYYLTAIRLSKESDDYEFKAYLYNNIALTYINLSQPESAINFLEKAKKNAENVPDKLDLLSYTYDNIGSYYKIFGDKNIAIEYYEQSLSVKQKVGNISDIIVSFINLSGVAIKKNDFTKARKYLSKAMSYHPDTLNLPLLNIQINRNLGKLYYQTGDYNQAILHYKKCIQNYKLIKSVQLLDNIYYELANTYNAKGNYKLAGAYLQKTIHLRDSLFTTEMRQIITELNTMLNQSIKSDFLQKEDNKTSLYHKLDKKLIILAIILSILFILLIGKIVHEVRKNKKLLILLGEKKSEISELNKILIKKSNELELLVNKKTQHLEKEIKLKDQLIKQLKKSIDEMSLDCKSKDMFIENLQYEIRTPLNSIIGLIKVFNSNKNLKEKDIKIIISGIEHSSERLLSIFYSELDKRDLLADNNIRLQLHAGDLNRTVELIYLINQFKANKKRLNFDINLKEKLPKVYYDKKYLLKVIYNVLDNAIKYTDSGFVRIETGDYDNRYAIVKIADSGKGIPGPKLKRYFEKKSLNKNIKGLGLPVSIKLMEFMDGKLEISSKEGEGTVVTLYLSYFNKTNDQERDELPYNQSINKKENNILIVEDDEFNNVLLTNIVSEIATVTTSYSGKEARDIIEKKLDKNEIFNLVLLDINLPDGFSGLDLLQEIHNAFPEYKNIPFIAITAYANEENKVSFLKKGFADYFIKPFNNTDLINKIKYRLNF